MSYSDLAELIEKPNCDIENCKDFHCGCSDCGNMRLWKAGEIEERFTIEQQNEIKSKQDSKTGYFRESIGCILPRNLRPAICLRYTCKGIITTNYYKEIK